MDDSGSCASLKLSSQVASKGDLQAMLFEETTAGQQAGSHGDVPVFDFGWR
jgi:hypothetical protein